MIWPYHNSKLPLPSTYGAPFSLPTVVSSSSSTLSYLSDTPPVVRLADGTTHHLVPIDALTHSPTSSPSSTPPIPIPPPHLRYRSPPPIYDSDTDIEPESNHDSDHSTTAVDSDSVYEYDDEVHIINVSRLINPAHATFIRRPVRTSLVQGIEVTAYVSRSLYPILPGHVVFRFPTTNNRPAYTLYGIIALVQPTYFVIHITLAPYVSGITAQLHASTPLRPEEPE